MKQHRCVTGEQRVIDSDTALLKLGQMWKVGNGAEIIDYIKQIVEENPKAAVEMMALVNWTDLAEWYFSIGEHNKKYLSAI